jgi:surface antigen
MVSASNFAQGQGQESFLFGYIGEEQTLEDGSSTKHRFAIDDHDKNLALVPLADSANGVDPSQKEELSIFDVEESSMDSRVVLSSSTSNITKDPEEEGGGVTLYTVKDGDTMGGIAKDLGITVNTILWANDIDDVDEIKPGDQIFILPVAGLTHVVKSGETIEAIAKEYKADTEKIISFNSLPANGELEVGASITIPDGRKEEEEDKKEETDTGLQKRQYANTTTGLGQVTDISGYRTPEGKAGKGHRFPYGYCTWYVASKRYVPWGGNAGTWLYNAKAQGYKTGKKAAAGSIVVTTENAYYGHVALVEKVSGDTITVSDMNYVGWGKVSRRTMSASSRVIKGYIY